MYCHHGRLSIGDGLGFSAPEIPFRKWQPVGSRGMPQGFSGFCTTPSDFHPDSRHGFYAEGGRVARSEGREERTAQRA